MLKPLKQWVCDVCGEVIEKPEQGYVIWKSDENHRDYDFKIIHQKKCDLDRSYGLSLPINEFLGTTGLTHILAHLSLGPIKHNLGDSGNPEVRDIDEFVDLVRRFQIPYYEEARRRFHDPDVLDRLADANEVYPYLPEVLERIASGE